MTLPRTSIPCPWLVGDSQTEAHACGAQTTALLLDTHTGELDVACPEHVSILEGFMAEFGPEFYTYVNPDKPLHNTSIAFTV